MVNGYEFPLELGSTKALVFSGGAGSREARPCQTSGLCFEYSGHTELFTHLPEWKQSQEGAAWWGGGTGCPAATTFDIPLKWLPLGQIHGLEINLIPSQMLS